MVIIFKGWYKWKRKLQGLWFITMQYAKGSYGTFIMK